MNMYPKTPQVYRSAYVQSEIGEGSIVIWITLVKSSAFGLQKHPGPNPVILSASATQVKKCFLPSTHVLICGPLGALRRCHPDQTFILQVNLFPPDNWLSRSH